MSLHDIAHRIVWIGFSVFAGSWALLGIWDLVLIARGKLANNSASTVILEIASEHPFFVFVIGLALGVLVGHLLWAQILRVTA